MNSFIFILIFVAIAIIIFVGVGKRVEHVERSDHFDFYDDSHSG